MDSFAKCVDDSFAKCVNNFYFKAVFYSQFFQVFLLICQSNHQIIGFVCFIFHLDIKFFFSRLDYFFTSINFFLFIKNDLVVSCWCLLFFSESLYCHEKVYWNSARILG